MSSIVAEWVCGAQSTGSSDLRRGFGAMADIDAGLRGVILAGEWREIGVDGGGWI
jgi:hypothetical protein